jgi:hypothetical protein
VPAANPFAIFQALTLDVVPGSYPVRGSGAKWDNRDRNAILGTSGARLR